jgi:glycerol dehydrogenase-like iron-containing ADH family enzyme
VIGFLYSGTPGALLDLLPAFRRANLHSPVRQTTSAIFSPLYPPSAKILRETGYIEGHIEFRWGENRYDRVPALAEDLVQHSVDVIVAVGGGGFVAKAAKAATASEYASDPGCPSHV